MEIHEVLKNCQEMKTVPSFDKGDHVKSKYIIEKYFWLFENTEKSDKLKIYPKMTSNDL